MGIIYIGDRSTGKTNLATELANPHFNHVQIKNQNYQELIKKLRPTDVDPNIPQLEIIQTLDVEVNLPAGPKNLLVEWLDTPGEVWRRSWRKYNGDRWTNILSVVQRSEGIIVVLPPYREIPNLKTTTININELPTLTQWCKRFERWVEFFRFECPQAKQIVICLNKADLFTELDQEERELAYYAPSEGKRSRRGWQQKHLYVAQKYFRPVEKQILEMSKVISGAPVQCFITSIYNRSLLELPWIYLASHL
jgi:GTPase SAR1 family protein